MEIERDSIGDNGMASIISSRRSGANFCLATQNINEFPFTLVPKLSPKHDGCHCQRVPASSPVAYSVKKRERVKGWQSCEGKARSIEIFIERPDWTV